MFVSLTEQRLLRESDYPLIERVLMGPLEGEAQIFIYEKGKVGDISEEVSEDAVLYLP